MPAADRGRQGARGRTATSAERHRAWDSWPLLSGGQRPPCRPSAGRRPQARQEIDQGRHLVRADLLAVRRHVAAAGRAIADLVDELAGRQSRTDARQVRAALPAAAFQGVTVAAVLVLEHDGPLELPRGAPRTMSSGTGSPLQADICGDQGEVPPGRSRPRDGIDHDHGQTATGRRRGALAPIGHERDEEQGKDQEHREDQDDKRLGRRRG